MAPRVRVERENGIGRLTLARPEKKNALDQQTAVELFESLESLEGDADVRVVILSGDGDDFCAGADLEALEKMLDATPDAHRDDAERLGRVFVRLRSMTKPVIAAVKGRALAGGAGLATACDIVLAHENATFGYPEVRVGFVPAMVMTMLRRSVGEKHAFDLVATARIIDAAEAERIGLASRVVPAAQFDAEVLAVAAALAKAPQSALMLTKRLFYQLDTLAFDASIAAGVHTNVEARATADFRDGVRRFTRRKDSGT
jgi:methylglutaconyl-CoA hydratase